MEANPFQRALNAVKSGDRAKVRDLLSVHADVAGQSDVCGWSLLHYAASKGIAGVAEVIIEFGGDVDLRDRSGATPLLLRGGADPSIRDADGRLPADVAETSGGHSVAELLRGTGEHDNRQQYGQHRGPGPDI